MIRVLRACVPYSGNEKSCVLGGMPSPNPFPPFSFFFFFFFPFLSPLAIVLQFFLCPFQYPRVDQGKRALENRVTVTHRLCH